MDGQTFLIAVLGIIMGSTVLIIGIAKITDLIKTWMGRNTGYDAEEFERLARAFVNYKKSTDQRLRNLETIASNDDDAWEPEVSHGAIEMNEHDEGTTQESSNLRNMLRS